MPEATGLIDADVAPVDPMDAVGLVDVRSLTQADGRSSLTGRRRL